MDDVLRRADAMSVTAKLWPRQPTPESSFAEDQAACPSLSTYVVTRIQLLEAISRLETAADLVRKDTKSAWGAHLVILRPALVLAAKAAWIVRPTTASERVSRAVGMVIKDQEMGSRAIRDGLAQGAPSEFRAVGNAFERTINLLAAGAHPHKPTSPGREQTLILDLASDVDRYYGGREAASDMQLLWNSSSSLAHGERWFSALAGGARRSRLGDMLTARSLDVVCSGINVTSLRLVQLAVAPAPDRGSPPSAELQGRRPPA